MSLFLSACGFGQDEKRVITNATLHENNLQEEYYFDEFFLEDFVFEITYSDGSAEQLVLSEKLLDEDDLALLKNEGTHEIAFIYKGYEISFTVTLKTRYYDVVIYDKSANEIEKHSLVSNSNFTLPEAKIENGYNFLYWSVNGAYYYPKDEIVVQDNLTITPIYEAREISIYYTYKYGIIEEVKATFDSEFSIGNFVVSNESDDLLLYFDCNLFTYELDGDIYQNGDKIPCNKEEYYIEILPNQETPIEKFTFKETYVKIGDQLVSCYVITDFNDPSDHMIVPATYNGKMIAGYEGTLFNDRSLKTLIFNHFYFGDLRNYENSSLRYIEIIDSPLYQTLDGVVYDKDLKELILYPCQKKDREYTVLASTVKINDDAFAHNTNLVSAVLPEGLKEIGVRAFYACHSLSKLVLPKSVKRIGVNAFYLDPYFSSTTKKFDFYLHELYYGGDINDWAQIYFEHDKISDLHFSSPASSQTKMYLTINGEYSDELVDLVINEGVDVINMNQFRGINNIRSITIPESLEAIEACAFADLPNLEKFIVHQNNPVYRTTNNGAVLVEYNTEKDLFYEIVCAAPKAPNYELVINYHIRDYAFYNCDNITKITLPTYSINIGRFAFYDCDGFNIVDLSQANHLVGYYAFSCCDGIKTASIRNDNDQCSAYIFANCNGLRNLNCYGYKVPYALAYECYSLENIDFGNITIIEPYAFSECINLKNIEMPVNLVKVDDHAFYQCYSLEEVVFPQSTTLINDEAFAFCYNLKKVIFEGYSTAIDNRAFFSCNIEEIKLPVGMKEIDASLTEAIAESSKVVLPENLEIITNLGLHSLKIDEFIMPSTIKYIGEKAFPPSSKVIFGFDNQFEYIHHNAFGYSTYAAIYINANSTLDLKAEEYAIYDYLFGKNVIVYFENEVELLKEYQNPIYFNIKQENIYCDENFHYLLEDDEAMIVYHSSQDYLAKIPNTITVNDKIYPVTAIGDYAFTGYRNIIFVPHNIKTIGTNAFNENSMLIFEDEIESINWKNNWFNSENSSSFNIYESKKQNVVELDDFIYEINDTATVLAYIGKDRKVNVPAKIIIDEQEYSVKKVSETTFIWNDDAEQFAFEEIVLEEGIEIFDVILYSDFVGQYLYLPKSIKLDDIDFFPFVYVFYPGETDIDGVANSLEAEIITVDDFVYFVSAEEVSLLKYIGEKDVVVIPETINYHNTTRKVNEIYINSNGYILYLFPFANYECDLVYNENLICIEGLYYYLKGNEAELARVFTKDNDVIIPEEITYEGEKYTVTSIKYYAFNNSKSNGTLTIPKTIKYIDKDTRNNFRSIYYNGTIYDWNNIGRYKDSESRNERTNILDNTYSFYLLNDENEYEQLVDLEFSGQDISSCFLAGYSGLKTIKIGSGVKKIEINAFLDCFGVEKIILSDGIEELETRSLFTMCVKEIIIPKTIKYVGVNALNAERYLVLDSKTMDDWAKDWRCSEGLICVIK